MADTENKQGAQHLCVLIHGFWGDPKDLDSIAKYLYEKHPSLHLLIAKRNSGNFTYDGIELGGERVCREIEERIQELARDGRPVTKLSLIGYSLGGLIARYAIGLLYSKGVFEDIEPVSFTTFVTPHLGVRAPLRGWHSSIWNSFGARTLLTSGRQLFMVDKFRDTGRPLLEILADPHSIFMQGLAKFQRRTLYTNIVNDRSAVYYTTSISKQDPFTDLSRLSLTYLKGYEDVILDPEAPMYFPEDPDVAYPVRLARKTQDIAMRLPFLIAMVSYLPIGIMTVIINSSIHALSSSRRIRQYEQGLTDIQPSYYRVPLLITSLQGAVGDVYQNVNSAQSHEYLDVEDEEAMQSAPSTPGSASLASCPPNAPVLALSPDQFKMIEALDAVGWRKFQVHIHNHTHSHAAIIVRVEKPSFDEGRIVLRHFVDEEFIV